MKAFHISLALFALLAVCIISNVIFIHSCADRLSEFSEELYVPTEEKLCELEDFWESRRRFIGLSISEAYLDNISKTISSLRWAYESGDSAEVEKCLMLLSDSAEAIRRYESLSMVSIF
ncbi:MAG: hypothetical protein IJ011_10760 [Clostridia bacterium]|nr:hypothetical protein [Clostridia bacterium]MBQ8850803.1 hypothetical protein [Clostridia bacterium]